MGENRISTEETTAEFCARMRRAVANADEGLVHLWDHDARRLGFQVERIDGVKNGVTAVYYSAPAQRVRELLDVHEKGLAGQLADLPSDPGEAAAERRRSMRTPEQVAEETRLDAEGAERARRLGLLPRADAIARTLSAELLFMAEEWERGAAKGGVAPDVMRARALEMRRVARSTDPRRAASAFLYVWMGVVDSVKAENRALEGTAAAYYLAANRLRATLDGRYSDDPGHAIAPSVLYDDSPSFRQDYPQGRFLAGEIDALIDSTESGTRALALSWSGVAAELRPEQRASVGANVDALRAHLTAAYHAAQALSEALEGDRYDGTPITEDPDEG